MTRVSLPLLALLICVSCAGPRSATRQDLQEKPYFEQIREWQQRIQKEGWAETQVHGILNECVQLVEYSVEIDDHWDTPREFMERGFRGDCEDIAIFLMGTLKHLKYPYGVRIVAVAGMFEGHALLKVEMPDGTWKYFDTAPGNAPYAFRKSYRPVVEFDETDISYYKERS